MVEGLSEEQLRRPVLPSGWSILQLLNHLASDDETFWFTCVVGGDEETAGELGDGWQLGADSTAESVLAAYDHAIRRADAVLARVKLDGPPRWWPEGMFGGWRMETVREVVLHVIVETATHAGHLDAARELIDGRRWMVLDEG